MKKIVFILYLLIPYYIFSQIENKNDLINVNINGIDWLIESNNYLNQLNLEDFDSIDEKIMIEYENKFINYRIPTLTEINQLYNQDVNIPVGKIRKECIKTFKCTKDLIEWSYLARSSLAKYTVTEIVGWVDKNYKYHPPHICNNCKDWSEKYKAKVPCTKCKDERKFYCGNTFTCFACNGKGFYMEDTEEETLSFENYLTKQNLKNNRFYLYYNNPKDYGIYDLKRNKIYNGNENYLFDVNSLGVIFVKGSKRIEKEIIELKAQDELKTAEILDFINSNDFENARINIKLLNYPKNFPYQNKLNAKEDSLLLNQINTLLIEKKIDIAIEKYDALNLSDSKNSLKNEMQTILSDYYKSFEKPFTNEQLINIINELKYTLSKLSPGNHQISTDSDGKISIDSSPTGLKMLPFTKSLGQNGEFIVNTSSVGTIKIEKTSNNNGPELILVSTNKAIYKTGKGKLYKKVFLGQRLIFHQIVSVTVNEDIPKNKYRFAQPLIVKTTANGIEINSILENDILSEHKFKSRLLTISSRALSITGGLTSSIFIIVRRIYENSLIP
jgi:hypothetical protein